MRRIVSKVGTLAAGTLLALTTAQATPASANDGVAYFNLRDVTSSSFTIKLTSPAKIEEARDMIARGYRKTIMGRIVKSTASYNPHWSFHLDPDTITFADSTIEACDSSTPYIQDHLVEAGGAFLPGLYWCPWSGRLTNEIPSP